MSVAGDVINGGEVRPGDSLLPLAVLTIDGEYSQTGSLEIELAGLVAGSEYDQLVVTGGAVLDGELGITVIDGFTPLPGDEFLVMSFGSKSGDFSDVIVDCDYAGVWFDLVYDSDSLTLVADALDGDADLNGEVGLGDLSELGSNWEQSVGSWLEGDFDGDGVVGLGDLSLLASQWGNSLSAPAPGGSPIPEPGSLGLLGVGVLAVFRRKRVV